MLADGIDLRPALTRLYRGGPLPSATLTKLKGDASTRSYYRIQLTASAPRNLAPRSLIAMRLPEDALRGDELGKGEAPSELPFVDVQRLLHARGIPVPEIYVDDTRGRALLLEDLGDITFEQRLLAAPTAHWHELYGEAIDLLARMHRACKGGAASESIAFRRSFDRAQLSSELDHLREYGLEALHGPLPAGDRAALDAAFDALADELSALPTGFVHRDYQSRHLMWAGGSRLTVIDFQDALQGPVPYDLVALLCDSYVALPQSLQEAMLDRYAQASGLDGAERSALVTGFWKLAVQRKLKDAGRFVFIDRVRGNPDFLPSYPQSLVYVGRALTSSNQQALFRLLERWVPGFPDRTAIPAAQSRR